MMRQLGLIVCMAWITLCSTGCAKETFTAGAAKVDITPKRWPISVNGSMRDRKASGAHDRLHSRAMVLSDGQTRLAIAIVDSCMIYRKTMDRAKLIAAKATGINPASMLISATHTHTAPTVCGVFQSDPDLQYQQFLAQKMAESIIHADTQRVPAEIGWAVGSDPTQVFNRRWLVKDGASYENPFGDTGDKAWMNPGNNNPKVTKPAGPIDPEIPIIAVRCAGNHRPIALLANYALHYVGGVRPLSSDYFGAFANKMERHLDPKLDKYHHPCIAMMSNGASGDINNINFALNTRPRRKPYQQIQIVADSVAAQTIKAYQTIKFSNNVSLGSSERDIRLGVRKPTTTDLKKAKQILKTARRVGGQLIDRKAIYARETVKLDDYPDYVPVKLQAFRIGSLSITAIPCEVFVEIGLELKAKSPLKPSFTIGLANGYNGYLPTPEQHALGGYETWRARSSYLEVNASGTVVRNLLEMLNQIK